MIIMVVHKWDIDNSSAVFLPPIKYKPHSLKPLSFLLETEDTGLEFYGHPYEVELEAFKPSEDFLQRAEPQEPKSLEDTPYEYIDTEEAFLKMCKKLEDVTELAIDLEHHSFRSFLGFTCLMQLSTRTEDYIVDTIQLRDSMHHLLEILANPKILKVFHGADSDICWLQRDFGLYVINMFDTGQASRVLGYTNFSLNYLVQKFCNIQLDKKYQLADWRMRPLSVEMLTYARMDTHYLLYIYDLMKNELLDRESKTKNVLITVFNRSKEICLKSRTLPKWGFEGKVSPVGGVQRYDKPHAEEGYLIFCQRYQKTFNRKQLEALKNLYAWRDRIAREKDESTG
ncbi:CDC5L [Cordylochernes scorpioides]|uniref:CDC5L n=1 Tax=Cordylochernes scorpioides TaxID=51811 RepID=A0ABY6LPP1_9ARAC|nr:CDC5L [Cordylochernes scorpioides]